MSRARSLKHLLTLSTETLTYLGGIIAPWILDVLVGSGGEKTPRATMIVAFSFGICSSHDVNGALMSSTGKRSIASSWFGNSVEAQLLFNWSGGLILMLIPRSDAYLWALIAICTCFMISSCILACMFFRALVLEATPPVTHEHIPPTCWSALLPHPSFSTGFCRYLCCQRNHAPKKCSVLNFSFGHCVQRSWGHTSVHPSLYWAWTHQ